MGAVRKSPAKQKKNDPQDDKDEKPLHELKRIRTIFVAYPYKFGRRYREALDARFSGSGIEFRYADEKLLNAHVMEKIRRMMSEADVSLFDVTDNNANVFLELGHALGANEPGFVVINNSAVASLSADLTGWDQLRYTDFDDLAEKLFEFVSKNRVPRRRSSEQVTAAPDVGTRERLRMLRFGIPAVDEPLLCVYALPIPYERYAKDRSLLGSHPYRAQDLCDSILAGPNTTGYRTYFWPTGFSYDAQAGPDFVEVYDGHGRGASQTERSANFRVYTSGAAMYMQRLRFRAEDKQPFLYRYMFQNIVEMVLIAVADVRKKWVFSEEDRLDVGAVFQHARDLRVSEASPDVYSADDAGRTLGGGDDDTLIPDVPITIEPAELLSRAKAIADEMSADLRTKER